MHELLKSAFENAELSKRQNYITLSLLKSDSFSDVGQAL